MELESGYLIGLARDKSLESRNRLSQIIIDMFDDQKTVLTDRDRAQMFGIMHGLIQDAETSIRKNFSLQLASCPDAPTDLIIDLANDEIDVAYPILINSLVLRDEDLIQIIKLRAQEYQLAITLRHDISEDVSNSLIEESDEGVITSLLNNKNARISESSIEYLVEQSKRFDSFQEPLLHRDELPDTLAKKMFVWVSDALRTYIIAQYNIDETVLSDLMKQTLDYTTQNTKNNNSHKLSELAHVLKEENLVSPNMIMSALNDGEAHLFISLFSQATQLNEGMCSKILFDHSSEPLAIACKVAGLNYMQFGLLFNKTRKNMYENMYEKEDHEQKALSTFTTISTESASKVVLNWINSGAILPSINDTVSP